MATKITRKEAEAILSDYAQNADEVIVNSGCVTADKFIVSQTYIDKGDRVEEFYCQECGSTHKNITKGRYVYGRYTVTCPTCGNQNYTSSRETRSRNRELFVETTENGFKFAVYNKSAIFGDEEKWWLTNPMSCVYISYVGMFDEESGWYIYDVRANKLFGRNSESEKSVLTFVKSATPVNDVGGFDVMIANANVFEAKRSAENAVKKAKSKTTLLEEMRQNYKPKPVDLDMIKDKTHSIMYEVYSTKGDTTTYMACCSQCGHVFETTMEEDETGEASLVCPNCGRVGNSAHRRTSYYYSSGNRSEYSSVVIFENTNLPENDLLIRLFEVNMEFTLDKGLTHCAWEKQRIFCGKKINVYGRHKTYSKGIVSYGDFQKDTIRDIDISFGIGWRSPDSVFLMQEGEDIANTIRNSCLAYSGLVESYGFGDERYKGYSSAPSLKYLMTWYKKPAIELILKANMTALLEHVVNDPSGVGEGSTLAEALCVTPAVAKIAAKLDLPYSSLTDLIALYNADQALTADSFLQIKQMNIPVHQLVQLKNTYNIDYAQTSKYLEAVYNHQCIEKREALTLWVDYLRMATALKIDLTDKSRMYPGSLKKEHDVATFAYRAIQIEVDKERFADQAEKNAYFEYSYKDLVVIIPRTPQEIIEEATRQKNCLRSYVESVKEGRTVVAFIRRKIMPDATYVTAEVRNGELTQLKGYCNSNPRNKELVEFVQHWSKAKGIRVMC